MNRPVSSVVETLLSVWEVAGSFSAPVKLHTVANDSPSLRRFFGAVLPMRYAVKIGPDTRYTLRRNTMSNEYNDDLIFFILIFVK